MTSRRRPPTFIPAMPWSQPGMTWPPPSGNVNGSLPRSHEESNCSPVDHELPTYWTDTLSPGSAALPLPLTMSVDCSSAGGSPSGFATSGFFFRSLLIVAQVDRSRRRGSGVGVSVSAGGAAASCSSSPQAAANTARNRQARRIGRRLMCARIGGRSRAPAVQARRRAGRYAGRWPYPTGSRHADASALEALVDAAAGILAADSLSDTLGRIAHHLGELLDYDELSVYEVDYAAGMLVPVFALGEYARRGDGRHVPGRRGRDGLGRRQPPHPQRRARRPGSDRRRGRGDRDGAGVARLGAADRRRPRRGGAERLPDRRRQAVQRRRGRDRSSASRRWPRSPSTRRASATRCASRRAPTGSRASSTTAPATSACRRRSRAPRSWAARSASSCSTSTTSRPSTTPTATPKATRC